MGGGVGGGPMGRERDHYRSYGLFMVSAFFFSDFPGVLRLGRLQSINIDFQTFGPTRGDASPYPCGPPTVATKVLLNDTQEHDLNVSFRHT